MSLKYEPASEPLHISVKWLLLTVFDRRLLSGGRHTPARGARRRQKRRRTRMRSLRAARSPTLRRARGGRRRG